MLALLLKDNHTDLFLTCEMKVTIEERGGFKLKLFSATTTVLTTNSIFLQLLLFFEDVFLQRQPESAATANPNPLLCCNCPPKLWIRS